MVQLYKDWRPTGFDPRGLGLDDRQEWIVAPVIRTRDSGPLDESNFAVVLADLGGESDTIEVHRFGHWGPGWFEIILCAPEHAAAVESWESALRDYPVADDSDFSAREYECARESWTSYGCDAFVRALASAFDLHEPTIEFLSGAEHEDSLWDLHMRTSPEPYLCEDSGASFDFRYLDTRTEPSRDTLARAIRAMRRGQPLPR